MKKIISILLIIVMILSTSCIYNKKVYEATKLEKRKKKEGKEIAEKIVECINNQDAHGIAELYCEKYKKNTELEWNVMDVLEKIDVKIDSYEVDTDGSGETSISDGKIVYDYSCIYIKNINGNKDNDKNIITIGVVWVDDENKNREGLNHITVRLNDERYRIKTDRY
ncbi:protein of unknown function [Lachnospiraceae bacterium RM5]|nr:protein of unknown function [Lachnospiraceae bacterium RM5]